MPGAPPKVFISYSHDSPEHRDRVLVLANRLRKWGIDAEIDQYETSPPKGWPAWCERQIKWADFVLLVCTETYLRRVDGGEVQGIGYGVLSEAHIIRQLLFDAGSVNDKFVPVLFSDGSPGNIPTLVKGATHFVVDNERGYEDLYRLLTDQPRVVKPELGRLKTLPPKESKSRGTEDGAPTPPEARPTPAGPSPSRRERETPPPPDYLSRRERDGVWAVLKGGAYIGVGGLVLAGGLGLLFWLIRDHPPPAPPPDGPMVIAVPGGKTLAEYPPMPGCLYEVDVQKQAGALQACFKFAVCVEADGVTQRTAGGAGLKLNTPVYVSLGDHWAAGTLKSVNVGKYCVELDTRLACRGIQPELCVGADAVIAR
jgi:hypothetical protein